MDGPTNSDILWGKIRLAEGRLFAATEAFWNHPRLPRMFPEFLVQTFFIMRSGIGLMRAARALSLSHPNDPISDQLASYLEVHIEEECDHDVWLLDDICTLGLTTDQVLRAQPYTSAVNLIGAQHFWMNHAHPVTVMAYLVLMEGYAPIPAQLDLIQVRSGAPATAFRCLVKHAEDDPSHIEDLNRTLDSMRLTLLQTEALGMAAFSAIDNTAALFDELIARSDSPVGNAEKDSQYASA